MGVSTFLVAANTSTGNQTFTGSLGGETPVAAILEITLADVKATLDNGISHSYGITDGSNHHMVAHQSEYNRVTIDARRRRSSTDLIYVYTATGAEDAAATFVSFGANAITVNWDTAPAQDFLVKVTLFSGVDAAVGNVAFDASEDGTTVVSGLGFQPSGIIFVYSNQTTADVNGNDGFISLGFAADMATDANVSVAHFNNDAQANNNPTKVWADTRCIIAMGVTGSVTHAGEVTAYSSGGFTLTTRDNGPGVGTLEAGYLALGGNAECGVNDHTVATSGSPQSFTGYGVDPTVVLTIATQLPSGQAILTTNGTAGEASSLSFGAFTATEECSVSFQDDVGNARSVCKSYADDTVFSLIEDGASPGVDYESASGTLETDGFDLVVGNFPTTDARIFMAMGIEIAVPTTDADGTPQAETAEGDGSGTVSVAADGTPQAATAQGDGDGVVSSLADGTPQADTAQAAGTGVVTFKASGTPQAETALGDGTAVVSIAADGTPQAATAQGDGNAVTSSVASGSPQAETALGDGTGIVSVDASGNPQAETATGDGTGTVIQNVVADGTPQADTALGNGTAEVSNAADGTPQAATALGSGNGVVSSLADGTPQAETAIGSGSGVVSSDASGSPQAQTAIGSGSAIVSIGASGNPQAETATGAGTGVVSVIADGTPQADTAQGSGSAVITSFASGSPQAQTAIGNGTGIVTGAAIVGVIDTLQAMLQVAISGDGAASASQLALLAAYSIPEAKYARSTEGMLQVAYVGGPIIATTAAALLVAYRTGPVENLKARAWEFTLDGHTFYVLTLGEQGTFLYDLTTQQWAEWITGGLNTWNMEIGTTWKGKVVAGDQAEPTIWEMTPNIFLDDGFKAITRVATGGLSIRQRETASNYAFRITASMGAPVLPITAPVTLPTMTLAISDDQGKTFRDMGSLTLVEGEFRQTLQWLSLGIIDAPVRVFKITDVGAVARIDGADAEVEPDEDKGAP